MATPINMAVPNDIGALQRAILILLFLAAIFVATVQVHKEYKILQKYKRPEAGDLEAGPTTSPGAENEQSTSVVAGADTTRSMFRRWLWVALILRTAVLPFQGDASDPDEIWFQVVADTMPEMVFCSAWTLLVQFLIQLVGIASGETATLSSSTIVVQLCIWTMYIILIVTDKIYPTGGGELLYSLLAFIYTGLFGLSAVSGPRLISLLRAPLSQNTALAMRLSATCITCAIVFGARVVCYCMAVVQAGQSGSYMPDTEIHAGKRSLSWWWSYGCLELLPATLFLFMMHPRDPQSQSSISSNSSTPTTTPPSSRGYLPNIQRTGSYGSTSNTSKRESAPLIKPSGTAVATDSSNLYLESA